MVDYEIRRAIFRGGTPPAATLSLVKLKVERKGRVLYRAWGKMSDMFTWHRLVDREEDLGHAEVYRLDNGSYDEDGKYKDVYVYDVNLDLRPFNHDAVSTLKSSFDAMRMERDQALVTINKMLAMINDLADDTKFKERLLREAEQLGKMRQKAATYGEQFGTSDYSSGSYGFGGLRRI